MKRIAEYFKRNTDNVAIVAVAVMFALWGIFFIVAVNMPQ